MPPAPLVQLVDDLCALQLLRPAQWQECVERATDSAALLEALRQRGWLTAWQLDQLAQGQGQALLLDRYVLLDQLGEGGMGVVCKARHLTLERIDAVKLIHPTRVKRADSVTRFYREARAMARLQHPHLITVYDAGSANGRHYLAMEYLEGSDLARLVRAQGPLAWQRAAALLHQVALGLQHAHEKGLVHRDLKPSNLLLATATQQVKILDLGLARFRAEADTPSLEPLTQEQAILGTPDYMAPEQAEDTHRVDIRADLYSLGCTAYYLLAGHVPFPGGSSLEKLLRQRTEQPRTLARQCATAPQSLLDIVQRLLAKRPEDRYQTPHEVALALQPLLDTAALPSAATVSEERAPATVPLPVAALTAKLALHRRTQAAGRRLALIGLAFCGGGIALILLFWSSFFPQPVAAPLSKASAGKPTPGAASWTRRWEVGPLLVPPPELQLEWHGAFGVAIAPDKQLLAVTYGHTEKPLEPGRVVLIERGSWQSLGALSNAGRKLAFTSDGATLIVTTAISTGQPVPQFQGEQSVWDVASRKLGKRSPGMSGNIQDLDPAGCWLLSNGRTEHMELSDPRTWTTLTTLANRRLRETSCAAVAHEHAWVACGDNKGEVTLHAFDDTRTFVLPALAPGQETFIAGLAFRPGDRELVGVTGVPNGGQAQVLLWDVASKQRLWSRPHGDDHIFCMALAPDGRLLATGTRAGDVQLWDVQQGQKLSDLAKHPQAVYAVCFARDGTMLAAAYADGAVRVWHGKQ